MLCKVCTWYGQLRDWRGMITWCKHSGKVQELIVGVMTYYYGASVCATISYCRACTLWLNTTTHQVHSASISDMYVGLTVPSRTSSGESPTILPNWRNYFNTSNFANVTTAMSMSQYIERTQHLCVHNYFGTHVRIQDHFRPIIDATNVIDPTCYQAAIEKSLPHKVSTNKHIYHKRHK